MDNLTSNPFFILVVFAPLPPDRAINTVRRAYHTVFGGNPPAEEQDNQILLWIRICREVGVDYDIIKTCFLPCLSEISLGGFLTCRWLCKKCVLSLERSTTVLTYISFTAYDEMVQSPFYIVFIFSNSERYLRPQGTANRFAVSTFTWPNRVAFLEVYVRRDASQPREHSNGLFLTVLTPPFSTQKVYLFKLVGNFAFLAIAETCETQL
ncbi:hypothetical protein ARMGADRAFT_733698 [Armillaria gallica]|uniref:Uncharacterized protein n=1 Tax=Armillaria gallica TaxID=47427 RepID=A0A2H3D4R4_ARMGA|nr:hypothetical protein ARMGADRAFT_733698 [Armillaria gallica]